MDRLPLLSSVKPEDLEAVSTIQRVLGDPPPLFRREVLGELAARVNPRTESASGKFQAFVGLLTQNSEPFQERLAEVRELPDLVRGLVEAGTLTLAMIKPQANTYDAQNLSDSEVASRIIDAFANPITHRGVDGRPDNSILPLKLLGSVSIIPSRGFVDKFYGGEPKEQQLAAPPVRNTQYPNRWEEYVDLMTSGPATLVPLYDSQGNAVAKARAIQGHWKPEKNTNPWSIRAQFGGGWSGEVKGDTYNSITHTSDSQKSAMREFGIWYKYIVGE